MDWTHGFDLQIYGCEQKGAAVMMYWLVQEPPSAHETAELANWSHGMIDEIHQPHSTA